MSDKTLKRLVLGQMGLLAVLAAVLVWVIFPDGASFAWRGFYQPPNPATLEGGIQWPVAIRTEKSSPVQFRPSRGSTQGDNYRPPLWRLPEGEDLEIQRLNDRIDCLERKAAEKDELTELIVLGC
jgi:hypothetical protein